MWKKVKKVEQETLYNFEDKFVFSVNPQGVILITTDRGNYLRFDVREEEINGIKETIRDDEALVLRKSEWLALRNFAEEQEDYERAAIFNDRYNRTDDGE